MGDDAIQQEWWGREDQSVMNLEKKRKMLIDYNNL